MNNAMIVCLAKNPEVNHGLHVEYIRYLYNEDYRDTIKMANELAETTGLIVNIVEFNPNEPDLITEVILGGQPIKKKETQPCSK